jgi:hypothetical protein
VTKPNYDTKQLYASAIIANAGSAPPSGPILVYTVIISDGLIQEETHEWRWYDAGTSLPFRTLGTSAPLHYVEEDGGPYQVWVYVGDPENLVGDHNLNNNAGYIQCPPFLKPGMFRPDMNGPLRRETRMENGKLTTIMTIGGKPVKKGR